MQDADAGHRPRRSEVETAREVAGRHELRERPRLEEARTLGASMSPLPPRAETGERHVCMTEGEFLKNRIPFDSFNASFANTDAQNR